MIKHKAVVMGNVYRKVYRKTYYFQWLEMNEKLFSEVLWEGVLESPSLEKNEFLYIKDKDIVAKVIKVAKSTEGGLVYWVDHTIRVIEDEVTIETRKEMEEDKKQRENEQLDLDSSHTSEKVHHNKKWWKFWK